VDGFCSTERQSLMLNLLMHFVERAREALAGGVPIEAIAEVPVLRRLRRLGEELPEDQPEMASDMWAEVDDAISALREGEQQHAG
jgi:vacuolar-type H+-ATPase catalytic subunit A/Vma1